MVDRVVAPWLDAVPLCAGGEIGLPSSAASVCASNGFVLVCCLCRLPGVCAEFDRDSRLMLSSLTVLFLRCISLFQPSYEKLPLRISPGVGACARALPVACHMPTGGLDSRNLSEALLTLPELAVEDRSLVFVSSISPRSERVV